MVRLRNVGCFLRLDTDALGGGLTYGGDVPLRPWNFQKILRSVAQSSQNKTDFDIFEWHIRFP